MLPGPVFVAELRTTARRARYYAARVLVGVVLLVVMQVVYRNASKELPSGMLSGSEVIRLAKNLFLGIVIARSWRPAS